MTAESPPCGPEWVHDIKHDGYRMMARRDAAGILPDRWRGRLLQSGLLCFSRRCAGGERTRACSSTRSTCWSLLRQMLLVDAIDLGLYLGMPALDQDGEFTHQQDGGLASRLA